MKRVLNVVSLSAALLAIPALAQQAPDAAASANSAVTSDKSAALTEGEVRKVDKDSEKLTIRHGALENLGMPAMTMVFRVKDVAMLDQVKAGDRIRFTAENPGGAFVVTRLERAQ